MQEHIPNSDRPASGPDSVEPAGQARGVRTSIGFTVRAVLSRLRFILLLVVVAAIIGGWDTIKNYWDKWTRPADSGASTFAPDKEFYCPMHPNVVRSEPDPGGAVPKCPICGMPLSLRKKGEAVELPEGVTGRVQLSPERIHLAGIATAEVAYLPLVKEITAVGYVTYDESRLSRIVTRVSGFLEKLYIDRTWITVNEGDPLAEIYSPELYSTVRELLLNKQLSLAITSQRERLRLLGISDAEIDKIVETGQATDRLTIRATRSGHVIRKEVIEDAHVDAGMTLFDIADLSAVWIEADVFEKDIVFLREGQEMELAVEAFPNRVFTGKVSLVHPHLEAATRTNAVRFEMENPQHELRPGMYATVRIRTPLADIEPFKSQAAAAVASLPPLRTDTPPSEYFTCPMHPEVMSDKPGKCPKCQMALEPRPVGDDERLIWWCPMHPKVVAGAPGARCDLCDGMKLVPKLARLPKEGEVLAVPDSAVVDTGSKKIVYVERESGWFDGLEVELGPRAGGFYAVVRGLEAGNRVAARGAFLIDAETRLNPAAAGAYFGAAGTPQSKSSGAPSRAAPTRPQSGAATQPGKSRDQTSRKPPPPIELSSDELDNIAKLSPSDRPLALAQAVCPVGHNALGSMGVPHKVEFQGQAVFLCCKSCETKLAEQPEEILRWLREQRPREAATGETGTRQERAP